MNKIIFLDRDGVINKKLENDYVKNWDEFIFLPNVLDAIKLLNDNGYKIIIVSNQAGIAKKLYTKDELDYITNKMIQEIEAKGGRILKTYYCHHKDDDNCDCRKPKPGLLLQAKKDFDIDFNKTWIIGDSERDIIAGSKTGCSGILIANNKDIETLAECVVSDLLEAVGLVIRDQ